MAPVGQKTGKYDFAMPKKGMSKVVVSPDFEHDSVIFAGASNKAKRISVQTHEIPSVFHARASLVHRETGSLL